MRERSTKLTACFSVTDRINEVDSNLNYLMGRLSLVTQQFNQIRSGLGDVLDNIRTGFKQVENEMKGKLCVIDLLCFLVDTSLLS
jgi:hypothetical protein